jgi:two-component system OmpR family sensor kinase
MFFLVTLAIVLIGFSVTVYYVARHDLYSKVDDELELLFSILTAAAEVEENSVEWKREELVPVVDAKLRQGAGQWMITDGEGVWIDGLPLDGAPEFLRRLGVKATETATGTPQLDANGRPWLVQTMRVKCISGRPQRDPTKYYSHEELILGAAVSLDETNATLARLKRWLAGMSLTIWLVSAVTGRWLARRALLPVTQMATAAREMSATDFRQRLPVSHTGDEVEDLGEAFNGLLVRMQSSYDRQRSFTGEASHQLRTPLTAILGQIEVALRRERDAVTYRETLETVQRQSGNLHRIVESLLFLARADGSTQPENMESIDLVIWIEEFIERMDGDATGQVRLESDTNDPIWVAAQTVLLNQLVQNLVDNGIKYGGPQSPVTVRLSRRDQTVTLAVEDQGPGIAEKDLPHVFEPFYRSSDVRKAGLGGHGLGLAVARHIATAHGGSLDAQNLPDGGAQFILELPLSDTDSPAV